MKRLKVYSTGICPICDKVKALLVKWGIPYEEIRVDQDQAGLREFSQVTNGARTVPQITIRCFCVGYGHLFYCAIAVHLSIYCQV